MERLELSRNTCSIVTFGCVGTLQSASHTVGEGLRDCHSLREDGGKFTVAFPERMVYVFVLFLNSQLASHFIFHGLSFLNLGKTP